MRLTKSKISEIINSIKGEKGKKIEADFREKLTKAFRKYYKSCYTKEELKILNDFEHLFVKTSYFNFGYNGNYIGYFRVKDVVPTPPNFERVNDLECAKIIKKYRADMKYLKDDMEKLRQFLSQFTTVKKLLKEAPEFEKFFDLNQEQKSLAIRYEDIKELIDG